MSIYDLDIKGMRKTLKKFNETLYGRTIFFVAYFFPFLAFAAFVGFSISVFLFPRTEVFISFYVSILVFIISFLIGTAYYYRELREFMKK
ncbi:hypothetical protein IJJ49_01375 [Candidatus Saccharibacteria bacterium]|nr:hypothetical protein [Candidatus Saccharibacteria bacterium]